MVVIGKVLSVDTSACTQPARGRAETEAGKERGAPEETRERESFLNGGREGLVSPLYDDPAHISPRKDSAPFAAQFFHNGEIPGHF